MAEPDFFIRQGDSGFVMRDVLKDEAGAAVNIQGATLKLQVYPIRGGAALIDATASNDQVGDGSDGSKGKVSYTWPTAKTDVPGSYVGQWPVTFGGGAVQTYPNGEYLLILISADPPASVGQSYVLLEEFKSTIQLRGEVFADDDVAAAIASAHEVVEHLTGRRFWPDADAAQVRVYSALNASSLWIDDLITLTTLKTDQGGDGVYEETWAASDYRLEPLNALADARPYTKIVRRENGAYFFPVDYAAGVQVTGKFGWAAVPDAVRDATTLLAHRLFKRKRENPYSTAGFGMGDVVVRIPTRDPDVLALLAPYRRDLLLA